jgi:hypothetical protein
VVQRDNKKKATEYEINCDGKVLKSQSSGKYLGIEIEKKIL